jgi:Carboxymuconolactone decarboxylase family
MYKLILMGAVVLPLCALAASVRAGSGSATLLDDAECWKRMPPTEFGGGQPLPSWAKAVAARLPRTAAAMLELDLAHRTKSPLEPALRAKMRWVIAHANRCRYGEAYALADLERAGADAGTIKALTGEAAGTELG